MLKNVILIIFLTLCFKASLWARTPDLDFSKAVIRDVSGRSETENAAIQLLKGEVRVRTQIDLGKSDAAGAPTIVVGTRKSVSEHSRYARQLPKAQENLPDGYTVIVNQPKGAPVELLIIGNDARGMLFGVGHVLRKATLTKDKILIPTSVSVETSPAIALRGHQLGYRPKVNSYDGFTVPMWEQYIRDLVVFGTNAVELMPPFTDDDADSPHFPLPQKEMLPEMSGLLKKYGLDVWMWYPLMHGDYQDEAVARKSLQENDSIFRSMPKLDVVFVPGGDPGMQEPGVFFRHIKRKIEVLHKYHPKAEIWMSPQGYSADWMNRFIELMKKKPVGISGIVHGPWTRMDVDSLRQVVPKDYPIRRYPDITHSIDAQYFVPDWDYAYTVTQNREVINPRPLDQQGVFRLPNRDHYEGFITYSEGVNDDVNKIIWSSLGWDPDRPVIDILREYSRYFIGSEYADDFAHALFNLEENWRGPLLNSEKVYTHHAVFQEMEKNASPQVKANWRFQMALYRSYYDAYTRSRLLFERHLEDMAVSVLRQAPQTGSRYAIRKATEIFDRRVAEPVSPDWRARVFELAEALFQSIRMQLSVPKYQAIAAIRGANLDLIDSPLNNRNWFGREFERIASIASEAERLQALDRLVNWQNPGPGGFYDDLGDPAQQPHVVINRTFAEDPNGFHTSFIGLPGGYSLEMDRIQNWRNSWKTYMQTIYGLPLELRYENLDPDAAYQVKVVYVEDIPIQLKANDDFLIHDYHLPAFEPVPVIFDIPAKATQNGTLSLKWRIDFNGNGPGRGCSVAEVWLIKKK